MTFMKTRDAAARIWLGWRVKPSGWPSEMTRKLFHDPQYLHDRAEEARRVGLQILDPLSRRTILEIAESYEALARRSAQPCDELPHVTTALSALAPDS
jgi:hypothetical protein